MGWQQALEGFVKSLTGASQVQPINPNTSAGQPPSLPQGQQAPQAAPQGQGFQASNLVVPALTGYLAALGSPRRAGIGGAISRGGLAGIGSYEQEQQARAQAAQQAQELALKQQQFGLQQKQFQQGQQKETQARQDALAANKANSDQLAAIAMQEPDPKRRAILQSMSQSVKGLSTPTKLDDLIKAAYSSNDLKDALLKAQIGEAGARTTEAEAGATKAGAETAAIPEKLAIDRAKAAKGTAPKEETPEAAELKTASTREKYGKEYDAMHPYGRYVPGSGYSEAREAYINAHMGGGASAGGGKSYAPAEAPPLPSGASHYVLKDGRVVGYSTSDGGPVTYY